jgi:hypothetical protein
MNLVTKEQILYDYYLKQSQKEAVKNLGRRQCLMGKVRGVFSKMKKFWRSISIIT